MGIWIQQILDDHLTVRVSQNDHFPGAVFSNDHFAQQSFFLQKTERSFKCSLFFKHLTVQQQVCVLAHFEKTVDFVNFEHLRVQQQVCVQTHFEKVGVC